MPSRIIDYSGTTSSLYLRQPRQSLNLSKSNLITIYNFIIRSMMGLNGLGLWLINSLYSVKKMSSRSILMVWPSMKGLNRFADRCCISFRRSAEAATCRNSSFSFLLNFPIFTLQLTKQVFKLKQGKIFFYYKPVDWSAIGFHEGFDICQVNRFSRRIVCYGLNF